MLRLIAILLLLASTSVQADPISCQGSALIGQVLKVAEPILREELGIEIRVNAEGGTEGGLLSVGAEAAHLGLMTRALKAADRALFPASLFDEALIGWQVLVPTVADDVWEAGIRTITREQMLTIYESDLRNWKDLGGPDKPVKFYNPKRGRGIWELFVSWLYKDLRLAPHGESFETVVSYADARDAVEFNASSISVMPPSFASGKSLHALGIKGPDGAVVTPTRETLAAGKYPLARPLVIISGHRFAGDSKRIIEFLLSPRGQAIVKSVGFAPVGEAAESFEKPGAKPAAESAPAESQ
jgi:phosphate transport system substrate-binding protein